MIIWIVFFIAGISCADSDPLAGSQGGGSNSNEWLIPQNEVRDGGPGKDGIPSLTTPSFVDNATADAFMLDNDLILAVKVGSEVRGYPHPILDWHEIVNDVMGDNKFAVTYCPLTGTGIGWNRVVNGEETTFGVSGLLYNTNLIPYDRKTDSNWSQMRNECVNGELMGDDADLVHMVEMSWSTWKYRLRSFIWKLSLW